MFRNKFSPLVLVVILTIACGNGADLVTPAATIEEPVSTPTSPAEDDIGGKIVFYSGRDGNDEIYIMNADGGDLTRLTNNSVRDFGPATSRDGRLETHVMNVDGTQVRTVIANPATMSLGFRCSAPGWRQCREILSQAKQRDPFSIS